MAPLMTFNTAWIAPTSVPCACAGGGAIRVAATVPTSVSATTCRLVLAVTISHENRRKKAIVTALPPCYRSCSAKTAFTSPESSSGRGATSANPWGNLFASSWYDSS